MTSSIVKSDDGLGPDSSLALERDAEGVDMDSDGREPLNSKSNEDVQVKENRAAKKGQRPAKNGAAAEPVEANGLVPTSGSQETAAKHGSHAPHKNHRRRRHARGRIQVKKGDF